jgi:hypothetical protein
VLGLVQGWEVEVLERALEMVLESCRNTTAGSRRPKQALWCCLGC